MDLESDVRPENLDSKLTSSSPSTHSEISTDGDASLAHSSMSSTDKTHLISEASEKIPAEPKTKKRRKQSNPLKCQATTSAAIDIPVDDVDLNKINEKEFNHIEKREEAATVEPNVEKINHDEMNDYDAGAAPENMSHKNILSYMNNMLYSSGNALGSDVPAQAGSRSKSLQLFTESSPPETTEDATKSVDCTKFFPGFYPQMPPLLPLNPTDIAGELSKLSNVFSQLAELPTQLTQTGFGMTQSNRSFITSSGVRIFNPEAYCELCEKEFCNKYFLKTHKANKHGVCSVDNGSFLNRASLKNILSSQVPSQVLVQGSENGLHGAADAYCNICQKSFCNKYFLKKHRQNIHGIIENGMETSPGLPSSIHVPVISSLSTNRAILPDVKSEENSSDHSGSDDQKAAGVSLSSLKNKLNGNSALSNCDGYNSSTAGKSKAFLPNKVNRESKGERFLCGLCNIEFCDKHYLDSHKQNKHGAELPLKMINEYAEFSEIGKVEKADKLNRSSDSADEFKGQMCVPCMKNFTSAESFHNHMLEAHGAAIKEENNKQNQLPNEESKSAHTSELLAQFGKNQSPLLDSENSNSSSDSSCLCSLCFMKFKDRSGLLLHFESCHSLSDSLNLTNGAVDKRDIGVFNTSLPPSLRSPDLLCDACPERFREKSLLMSHRLKAHGIISPVSESPALSDYNMMLGIEADYSFFLSEKQQRNSSPQSFCRICNKELCNKYFMKTHMLKMHGIDVEKLHSERSAKTTNNNSCCDICQKVLCNKYFLKIHKLNVHGIADDHSKSNSTEAYHDYNSTEVSNKKVNATLYNALPVSDSNNAVCSPQNSNKDNLFPCEICGQEFQSKLHLQVHLVNKHVNNNESKVADLGGLISYSTAKADILGASSPVFSKQNGGINERGKNEVMCSCCSFIKLEEKVHGDSAAGLDGRMLLCHMCSVSYRYSDHYQHHLLHRDLLTSESKAALNNGHQVSLVPSADVVNKVKSKPRKFKRFRCSKCDKTFRTRNRCLHHIQVMHKNKKGLISLPVQESLMEEQKLSSLKMPVSDHFVPKVISGDNTTSLLTASCSQVNEKNNNLIITDLHQPPPVAAPFVLPKNLQDAVIMQRFHLTEPKTDGMSKPDVFVPSFVYLPVSKKVSEPVTVAFTLTPA